MIREKVQDTVSKFSMLEAEAPVLVGVSGGADSVCLLILLHELKYKVAVAHLNHALRGSESDEDARFVEALAVRLGVPFYSTRQCVLEDGGNLENAARQARRKFFEYLTLTHGFSRIALAHTRDDRVETFLFNLFRGAGSAGLSSMEPVRDRIVRPLIESTRREVELHLESIGQGWRTDASNYDLHFSRNRIRHSIIPALSEQFNPNLRAGLAHTIEILESEHQWMMRITDSWLAAHSHCREGEVLIECAALAVEPAALQRRVLRVALKRSGSSLENVSFDRIESAVGLLEPGKSGKIVEFPDGFRIARNFGDLIVYQDDDSLAGTEFEYQLQIPGEIHIPEISTIFRSEVVGAEQVERTTGVVFADGGKLGPYVRIRNWKPGDYYRPVGLPAGKVKKLFQRSRIPRYQRHRWPLIVMGSSVVWVASFPVSREFAPGGQSQKIVAFEAFPI